ncbi:PLP-dependent aminotransferase family protein (plasmid) [Rhizobium sp. CB3090]|uniref:aminotransferase-like domain-containing protein n=1 Tax=Rhizobium sp. CB3090 TaxID=3039156 RepID=UPI0024B05A10|nr:PLP-dependent aminotransferase family protein [Rhizobium sp. CB3090]WFU12921.1 PLP-dependent aminotransferase family protein [Rhizobium sp. CB3090]
MLLKSPWEPRLAKGNEPIYHRLAAAIAEDLISGKIPPGARLPAQRDLSYRLGVGLGTVTKAYALLERQGLASSVHGCGMFATGQNLAITETIDLSVNVPPNILSDRLLSGTLATLASAIDAKTFGAYAPPQGDLQHRLALAGWLQRYSASVDAERMILCNGGQQALCVVLATMVAPDVCIVTDDLPFPGLRRIAGLLGLELLGLGTDHEGILPSALDRTACEVAAKGKRLVLFTNPTAQNPTGKTMSRSRLTDIAGICKHRDILIIEDDVYSAFSAPDHLCFLDLAPERTYYISSLAKILTPGLRIGILIAPSNQLDELAHVIRAQGSGASPIASVVMHRWVVDGVASHIASMTYSEAVARNELAASVFASITDAWIGNGFHMFLPMRHSAAVALAYAARENRILVTEPALSLLTKSDQSGIRLCLGAPTRVELSAALRKIATLLV